MNRCGSQWVATATLWLTGLAPEAVLFRALGCSQSKVLLHGAVLQLLGHPSLDVLVKLTTVDATLLAFLLSYKLPSGLKSVRTNASSVERHFDTVDGAKDDVEVWMGKTETARVDLIKVAEDLEMQFCRKS